MGGRTMKRLSNATCLLSVLVVLFGCGGVMQPSHPSPIPPAGPPSGPPVQSQNTSTNWQISTTSTLSTGTSPATIAGTIAQSNGTVAGAVHVDGWTCFDFQTTVDLSGTVTDGNISVTSTPLNGQVLTLTGKIIKKSNFPDVLTGTYAVSGGCADGDRGNISGTSVYSVAGKWAGNLTTSGGGNIHWNAELAQSNADSEGSFGLRGTIGFDGCFGAGTITTGTFPSASFILGQYVDLEIKTSNGTVSFVGTADNDGLIRGTYTVSGGPCDSSGTGYLSPWEY
jgi:hypothetical protein